MDGCDTASKFASTSFFFHIFRDPNQSATAVKTAPVPSQTAGAIQACLQKTTAVRQRIGTVAMKNLRFSWYAASV
jgi:transposase